jgi:DNA-binding CsgD family transcriptional regulator
MIEAVAPRTAPEIVGRDDELARVLGGLGWDSGGGGAVLVGGDAGIGKTALVGQVVRAAAGQRVLLAHCVGEAGPSLPYLPFVEVAAGVDASDPGLVDALVAARPALASLVPRLAGRAGPDAQRGEVVEAIHGALADLGRRGPVLLVVEDLHWADESSRELLTVLFTRGAPEGVSVLATYRSDDVHRRHPLAASLAVWSRLPALTRVELGPLAAADVREIVHRVDGSLGPEVVDEVVRRAEGNAFLAEELAAGGGGPLGAEEGDVGRLLLARVEQLDPDAQDVVRVAAVIGRRVPHALLERVAGTDPVTLRRALRAAVDHHVLEPRADGYEFRHALLAEAVIDDLLPTERLELHRACADALREDPTLGTPADLARHALTSGDRVAALEASLRAGDGARRMGGPAEALAHYETALMLLDVDPGVGQSVTLRAAAAANAAGRPGRAMALLRRRLDDGVDGPHERAELLGALAFAAGLTEERVDLVALTGQALDLLDESAPVPLRVSLLARRAEALMGARRGSEAVAVADEAMALAVEHDLTVDRADLESILAWLGGLAGDADASIRRLERVVAGWTTAPDFALLRAMHILAAIHYRQSDLPQALAGFERTAEEARRAGLGSSVYAVDSLAMAVTVAYELGEWDHALELVASARARELPEPGLASIEAAAAYVRAARGDLDPDASLAAARPHWREDTRIAVQTGAAALDVLGRQGEVDRMTAVHDELVDFLRDAWEVPRAMVEVRLAALALDHLGTAVRSGAGADRARWLGVAERLGDAAQQVWGPGSALPDPTLEARMWLARATAGHLRVRWCAGAEVSVESLADAWREVVRLAGERGDRYESARARARLGEVLTAAGDPGAEEALAGARTTARSLGAAALLADLDRAAPRPSTAEHLTAREQEVLALLAAGRSNGEIGKALFISTKTASVHVSNILAKLGAASRGEAVAAARARGLLAP